ncbi:MAG: hypothetical protein R3E96_14610 [Planctomycetota bacterium]
MRLYDLLGHLDLEHLAVLLPETPPEGAEQFAQNVRDAFDAGSSTIRHEICTYPLGQNDPGQGPGDGEEPPVESHEPQAEPALASDLSEAFLVPVSPFAAWWTSWSPAARSCCFPRSTSWLAWR